MRHFVSLLFGLSPLTVLLAPTALRASARPADNDKIYLPIAAAPTADELRAGVGVPLERDVPSADLPTIGASWYYNWSAASANGNALMPEGIQFVPMSYSGADPRLPANYAGYLLVFNEPDVSSQANLTPRAAVDAYLALAARYPQAKLVVGGVSTYLEWGGWYSCPDAQGRTIHSWTTCFLDEFDRRGLPQLKPQYWHAHAYLNEGYDYLGYLTPARARATLTALHARTGGTYWITEYSEVHGDAAAFCDFTAWMKVQPWIERFAPFASRVTGSESWYPASAWGPQEKVSLLDPASPTASPTLSDMGKAYASCAN